MKRFVFVGVTFAGLSLWACKDSVVTPRADAVEDFPLSIGSNWKYAIYDSVSRHSDTVNVTIEQKLSATPVKAVYLWQYQYRARTESLYVIKSNDTVGFSATRDGYGYLVNFIFPLQVGRRWGHAYTDSIFVTARESVVVPSGFYGNTFRIDQMSLIPNDYSHFQYWIEPDVGIVKVFRGVFITVALECNSKETWQLLSYSREH